MAEMGVIVEDWEKSLKYLKELYAEEEKYQKINFKIYAKKRSLDILTSCYGQPSFFDLLNQNIEWISQDLKSFEPFFTKLTTNSNDIKMFFNSIERLETVHKLKIKN